MVMLIVSHYECLNLPYSEEFQLLFLTVRQVFRLRSNLMLLPISAF